MEQLVELGAEVNAEDENGDSPLHLALIIRKCQIPPIDFDSEEAPTIFNVGFFRKYYPVSRFIYLWSPLYRSADLYKVEERQFEHRKLFIICVSVLLATVELLDK